MNRGIVYGLASAALFGITTPLAKLLLDSIAPVVLAALLYAGAGLGMGLLLSARRVLIRRAIKFPARQDALWLAGAVVAGGIVAPVAFLQGLALSSATAVSLLLNFEGMFTALFAWFVFSENFDRRVAIGMFAIVLGGIVLAYAPGQFSGWVGALLVVLACLLWAVDNNLTRKISDHDPFVISGIKGLVAGSANLSLAFAIGLHLPSWPSMAAAAVLGFFGYGVSLALFVLALRSLGTARASAYFSVAPLLGAVVAVPVFAEPVTWQLTVAGLLMAVGIWLHVSEHHSHAHTHEVLEHSHAHSHDAHHKHGHFSPGDGSEVHDHPHRHESLTHDHAHYPDTHHRHGH